MSTSQTPAAVVVAEEDALRAKWHRTLAALLARAPDADRLAALGQMTGDDTEYGQAISALAAAARGAQLRDTAPVISVDCELEAQLLGGLLRRQASHI